MWWRYCYFTICRKKTREKNLGIFSHQIHLSNSRCQWSVGACSSSVLHLGFWFIWRLHPIYIIVTSLLHYNWTISLTSQPHDITTLLAHKLHLLWCPFADQPPSAQDGCHKGLPLLSTPHSHYRATHMTGFRIWPIIEERHWCMLMFFSYNNLHPKI